MKSSGFNVNQHGHDHNTNSFVQRAYYASAFEEQSLQSLSLPNKASCWAILHRKYDSETRADLNPDQKNVDSTLH